MNKCVFDEIANEAGTSFWKLTHNVCALALEKNLIVRNTAADEMFGLDAGKMNRAQAKVRARNSALETAPAAETLREEVEADELEVAQKYAESGDVIGLWRPVSSARSRTR